MGLFLSHHHENLKLSTPKVPETMAMIFCPLFPKVYSSKKTPRALWSMSFLFASSSVKKRALKRDVNTINSLISDKCSCLVLNLRICLRDCVAASMTSRLHSSLSDFASLRCRRVKLHTKTAHLNLHVLEWVRSLKSGPVVHILKSTQYRHMRFTDVYCISNYFSHASKHEATKYHSSGLYKASSACLSLFFLNINSRLKRIRRDCYASAFLFPKTSVRCPMFCPISNRPLRTICCLPRKTKILRIGNG
jgi:hypothetical protein